MAIEIKEYVGFENSGPRKSNYISLTESVAVATPQQMIAPDSLMVDIEGIHSNSLTINDTVYSEKCLRESLPYWTSPYERPVIMHHNDEDGEIIGRVKEAKIVDSKRSGTPAILFTCNIGDENGIKGIKNGTLSTVSIGAMAFDVRCSICNQNLAEGGCAHEKGETYEGKLCYWTIEEMIPKEISYVIVPSDKYAQTMKVYSPHKKEENKESVEVNESMSVCDDLIKELTESVVSEEAVSVQEKVEEDVKVEEKVHIDEEVKPEEKKDEEEEPKKEAEEGVEEKPVEDKEEDKAEEKEEKVEEENKKEEEDSNKDDERDEKIKELEKELADMKAELVEVKKQLKKEKELKESANLELAKYKVQEKVNVARKIKDLKESIGMTCEDAEEIAKNNTISELNLIYKTLSETCNYTKLPNKLVMESVVDDSADNISKGYKDVKESASNEAVEDDYDLVELNNLHKRLFK